MGEYRKLTKIQMSLDNLSWDQVKQVAELFKESTNFPTSSRAHRYVQKFNLDDIRAIIILPDDGETFTEFKVELFQALLDGLTISSHSLLQFL